MHSIITRTAVIEHKGGCVHFPLPAWSVPLPGVQGRARYLAFGHPGFETTKEPWHHVEQLGQAHFFAGTGVGVIVVTRMCTRWLTRLDMFVEKRRLSQDP